MWVAGVSVRNDLVTVLARMLELHGAEDIATTLHVAVATSRAIPTLTMEDRQHIVDVLEDPPVGLAELRDVLLGELAWHQTVAS